MQNLVPEHLAPAFFHIPSGPINGHRERDYRCDFDKLQADMRTAWEFAIAKHIAVLTVGADRCGTYLIVAHSRQLHTLFGNECAWVQRKVDAGLRTEIWLGCIGHIRVFWREVTCVH